MKYNVDKEYLIKSFERIIHVPSPVGYFVELNPVLEDMAKELGFPVTRDNRSTTYITVAGKNPDKTIIVGAHADTLGLMIYKIEKDGKLRIRQLGGCRWIEVPAIRYVYRCPKSYGSFPGRQHDKRPASENHC